MVLDKRKLHWRFDESTQTYVCFKGFEDLSSYLVPKSAEELVRELNGHANLYYAYVQGYDEHQEARSAFDFGGIRNYLFLLYNFMTFANLVDDSNRATLTRTRELLDKN